MGNLKKILTLSAFFFGILSSSLTVTVALEPNPTPLQEAPVPGQPDHLAPPPTPTYEHALGKMLLTLLGLIVLIFLTIWMLRRLSGSKTNGASSRSIKILERRPISQKSVLYLIEVDGKQVMISESQLEVRTITTLEKSDETHL